MCFKFSLLCHLLNGLERNRENSRLSASKVVDLDTQRVRSWFNDHDRVIPQHGPEAVAFLSCLFPERRTDRVFELQERRLEPIIKQALGLGATRLKELQSWRGRDGTDFASTVERVMSASESDLRHDPGVTLEEIDETLDLPEVRL
jgi:DNA ligase 4